MTTNVLDCCVLAVTGHLTTMNAMIRIEQHFRQHTLFGVLSAQISLLGSTYLPEMSCMGRKIRRTIQEETRV